MLTTYPGSEDAAALPATGKVSWLDLLNPTDEERAGVESKYVANEASQCSPA